MAEDKNEKPIFPEPTLVTDMATRRAPDYQSIYVNNTKFGLTPFEISFIFGEIEESVEGKLYLEQKARILMSPLHAKIFLLVLAQNMQNFEAQFGEVKVPSAFLKTQTTPSEVEKPASPESAAK